VWQPCFRAHQQRINNERRAAHCIRRTVRFHNFREALEFVQEVGELAETEGHHPDIRFSWGCATVSVSTEKIQGLLVKDFIMASVARPPG
jgi:4a-hydroxytetrahydrobiopterin dehydratase